VATTTTKERTKATAVIDAPKSGSKAAAPKTALKAAPKAAAAA